MGYGKSYIGDTPIAGALRYVCTGYIDMKMEGHDSIQITGFALQPLRSEMQI